MITTKNFNDLVEYADCHPSLLLLLEYLDDFFVNVLHKQLVVTEIGRTEEEQRRICEENCVPLYISKHMLDPILAVDIRSWELDDGDIEAIEIAINNNWIFNFMDENEKEKCFKYHKMKSGAYHLHIQAGEYTVRRNLGK